MADYSEEMEGKRVLVTGSGTGIGRGIALEFAQAGACLPCNDRGVEYELQ